MYGIQEYVVVRVTTVLRIRSRNLHCGNLICIDLFITLNLIQREIKYSSLKCMCTHPEVINN